ncbi:MAG: cysteine synthase family protein [Synergistaceae bacterium]|nr:cysteine synthase family protein [Synergistaceae bacterium]
MLKSIDDYHIGHTPIVNIDQSNGSRIILKLERENFLGSVKARTGYFMIKYLPEEARGKMIIESTSGNLGFALGFLCKEAGLEFTCLIDETIADKKLRRLQAEGIGCIMVKQEEGFDLRSSRIRHAERMMREGGCFWVNQYDNNDAVRAHEETTGPELFAQTEGRIDFCVCPMGSGGTICGLGRYLKRKLWNVKICGAEPFGSTIYGTEDAPYINAGAGLKGKPGNILKNPDIVDMSFAVSDDEAIYSAKKIKDDYGISVGITSGMAYAAALRISENNPGSSIAVIAPDGGEAYAEYF